MEKLKTGSEIQVNTIHPVLLHTAVKMESLARRFTVMQLRYHHNHDEDAFMDGYYDLISERDETIFDAAQLVTDYVGGRALSSAEIIVETVEQGRPIRQTSIEAFLKFSGIHDYINRRQ